MMEGWHGTCRRRGGDGFRHRKASGDGPYRQAVTLSYPIWVVLVVLTILTVATGHEDQAFRGCHGKAQDNLGQSFSILSPMAECNLIVANMLLQEAVIDEAAKLRRSSRHRLI